MKTSEKTITKKHKALLFLGLILFLSYNATAQSRAERRAERAQQEETLRAEIAQVVESGNFSLELQLVPPPDRRTMNVSPNLSILHEKRTIIIRNDSIFGNLPFIGRSTVSHYEITGRDGGFSFNDPIQTRTVRERNRNYLVSFVVNQPSENLDITVEVDFSGNASMIIQSSRRADARYVGTLQPMQSEN